MIKVPLNGEICVYVYVVREKRLEYGSNSMGCGNHIDLHSKTTAFYLYRIKFCYKVLFKWDIDIETEIVFECWKSVKKNCYVPNVCNELEMYVPKG